MLQIVFIQDEGEDLFQCLLLLLQRRKTIDVTKKNLDMRKAIHYARTAGKEIWKIKWIDILRNALKNNSQNV